MDWKEHWLLLDIIHKSQGIPEAELARNEALFQLRERNEEFVKILAERKAAEAKAEAEHMAKLEADRLEHEHEHEAEREREFELKDRPEPFGARPDNGRRVL